MLQRIGRATYVREIGLVGDDGQVIERGLADLLRSALARWGLSPKAAILRYARMHLEAAEPLTRSSGSVAHVLGRMAQLGECAEVTVNGEKYIVPTSPRWIRTGTGIGSLLSVAPTPKGVVEQVARDRGTDIVRRIEVRTDEDQEVLRLAGVSEISLRDWFTPLRYLTYAAQRNGSPVRSDALDLSRFWEFLVSEVEQTSEPLSDEADVRAVVGESGTYFGSHKADNCEGRWRNDARGGTWCAYRRGYGSNHWHPIILLVDGSLRRAMDLFDADEWRWALCAQGHNQQWPERVKNMNGRVELTFPAPDQLTAALDILGPRRSAWSWEIDPKAPDLWKELY